ncbi:MAG: YdcF family protein, partial [Gammaproteobacteria bacterium]
LITLAVLSLYMASIPAVSRQLIQGLETHPAILPQDVVKQQAQAIVVLGGGVHKEAREYGNGIPDPASLVRTHYGAFLHKITGLPVLVSGGDDLKDGKRPATLMKETLVRDFNIPDDQVWAEIHSLDTFQNAVLSASLLEKKGIKRILLVTHASHMPRAASVFKLRGLDVIPAPTAFSQPATGEIWQEFIPHSEDLETTRIALHEYIGQIWYRLKYF